MKLLSIELQEHGATCESCGHEIKWLYTISLDTGSSIVVGSDCAGSLLSPEEKDILQKRANAAVREWRKQNPLPHEGETREEYITRRIAEKSNALAAWKWYLSLLRKLDGMHGLLHLAAKKQLAKRGVFGPHGYAHDQYGFNGKCTRGTSRWECSACQEYDSKKAEYEQLCKNEEDAILSSVENKFQANRFDFCMTAYSIRKV